ncbi:MAG: hypothetical protein HYU37_14640 [Acidobacteria bacterium]|nr:hypothetical protein [Acidobacteriota bacterium]
MTQIFLNDASRTFDPAPATWGELLEKLDVTAADEGRLLSAARFDGVDEPAFRDPALATRSLAAIGRIEVETAVPAAFLRACLLETIEPLQRVAERTASLAAVYRGRDLASGHEGLTEVAAELQLLTRLIDMLTGPVGLKLTTVTDEAGADLTALGATLDTLVSAQTSEDWLTVADILEYELEPAIRRWTEILTRVANDLQELGS